MTRYEVEQCRHPDMNESQLEAMVRYRGSDYELLIGRHKRHKIYERYIIGVFNKMGITTRTVNRLEYSEDLVKWCDVVFPVGGDGTFLMAARSITNSKKPVIGFNSDPVSSEGFLCLPKSYSSRAEEVLCKLFKGEFRWVFRSRIRVKLYGDDVKDTPVLLHQLKKSGRKISATKEDLHKADVQFSRLPFDRNDFSNKRDVKIGKSIVLSVLALNEIFVGENVSSEVSYFELRASPDDVITKVKSSGICISTGTGSTSWHLSMNRITGHNVERIFKCAGIDAKDFSEIAKRYNDSLVFRADDPRLCYTVRELISDDAWPRPTRGFSESLWIRSHCQNGSLVIDCGVSYPFNGGAVAVFEIHADDALCTVDIN